MSKVFLHLVGLWLLLGLGACAPANDAPLPTVAQLPTLVPVALNATPTRLQASDTPLPSATPTLIPSLTPSATITDTATVSPTATATITDTPTRNPYFIGVLTTPTATYDPNAPLDITFEGVFAIMQEFRQPIRDVMNAYRAELPLVNGWTVSAYRDSGDWAKFMLVPTELVENGWQHVEAYTPFFVQLIAERIANQWRVYWVESHEFADVKGRIPPDFYAPNLALPPLVGAYLLPWDAGKAWWAINTWHGGNALDFEPSVGMRHSVLASESGILREVCSDGYQSLLQIAHADGNATYYLHVTLALRVRQQLLDQAISRGQYLGELIRMDSFATPCGRGYSRHLHFIISNRDLLIDGMRLATIAESASCCANPPVYTSTNQRVDVTQVR
jgi:hypothetical protein